MALRKIREPGRPTIWMIAGQGPPDLAVGAGVVVWTILLSTALSLFCLKRPLNPQQPNKHNLDSMSSMLQCSWFGQNERYKKTDPGNQPKKPMAYRL